MNSERLYISHMLERIEMIQDFTELGRDYFLSDLKTQEAVLRGFEILGEAATKLPDTFRKQYNTVVWRQIIAMRNTLIHNYEGVALAQVWETITNDLPPLRIALEAILHDLDNIH